jgi:hypothetical protein
MLKKPKYCLKFTGRVNNMKRVHVCLGSSPGEIQRETAEMLHSAAGPTRQRAHE